MKTEDLMKYLGKFPTDSDVAFIAVDPDKRQFYSIREHNVIIDMGGPVFCLEVGSPKKFKDSKVGQVEGQTDIFDFLKGGAEWRF